jgi:asparagine synthase (glutamine-hydrolysing)
MMDSLVHRGPDGSGEQTGRSAEPAGALTCWFGHRRLKILDLSPRAAQPMASDDGRVMLTYNGEVYNFRELRRELEGQGMRFRSSGDTEVVLRAYEHWGERFVERLDGMFALALWDGRHGRLVLARDRVGKKPLFYTQVGDRLAFGSEVKALLQLPFVEAEPDWDQLGAFLTFGYAPWPATMYRGIRQVPPGSMMTFSAAGVDERSYWNPRPEAAAGRVNHASLATVAELLEKATLSRMASDVPLGALLSGGIDSSLVVALMHRHAQEPIHTFAIGFADDESFDERRFAQLIANRFGTRHTEFSVRLDAIQLLDRLLWHHDQPFGDSSALPTFVVSRLAHEHVTVVLNGDGGDELFAGYDRFRAAALSMRIPTPAADVLRRLAEQLPESHGYYSLRRRARRFLELADSSLEDRYLSWVTLTGNPLLTELVRPEIAVDGARASFADSLAEADDLPPLDRLVHANFRTYLPDDLCVKMDRMSMAHSVEARSPFLDTALIEYVNRIPARQRVGLRQVKPVLRKAFGPLLPQEIWDRPKHGFGVPVGSWFRGELATLFEDEVLAADARSRAVLDQAVLHRLLAEQRSGEREHGYRLWTVLTLERWLRSLERPISTAPPPDGVVDTVSSG